MSSKMDQSSSMRKNRNLFVWAASLTLIFALLEIVFGFLSGSLMIIGDGVHMSSDAISLILSLIATIMAAKAANQKRTFGYKRIEPIAAFINGLTLIVIPLYIMAEAISRLFHPVAIMPKQMIAVGILGLIINALVGYILSKGNGNLNMRSALLHVFSDMITSFSAVIAAVAILLFDANWVDPAGSILTSILIIRGGISITKESFNILMEGTPEGYSVEGIKETIQGSNQDLTVDDVKVWCVNEEEVYTLIRVNCSARMITNTQKGIQGIKELVSKATNIPFENIYVDVK